MDGISMMGLHCYDGHRTEHDFDRRKKETDASAAQIQAISSSLCEKGYSCRTLAVSYTHLDVYKRQRYPSAVRGSMADFPVRSVYRSTTWRTAGPAMKNRSISPASVR